MKILQISNYYYPHVGGIEQTTKDIVESLKENNDIRVFCFNDNRKSIDEEIDGVKVYRVGCFAKVFSQSLSLVYYKKLKSVINEFNPEAIHFHYPNPFGSHYLLKVLKKHKDIKLVVHWHLDITKQKLLKRFFTKQTKRLLDKASVIIATSENYLNNSEWLPLYKDKCMVIPSCINEKRLKWSDKSQKKYEELAKEYHNDKVCFFCGRHVEYKGLEYLIDAAKYLDDSYKVIIGGEGALTKKLKMQAGHNPSIVFVGKLQDSELLAYLQLAKVYCFPSYRKNEAFGLSLAEAMYYAKPAVTFTVIGSGINFVNLNEITGIEVANGDSKAFALAIKKLSEDEQLNKKYGNAAKARVLELFGFEEFKNNILNLYKKL